MQANGIGLDAFFESAHSGLGLYAALPDGVSITFQLSGEGGGVWSVVRDEEGSVAVSRRAVSRPDCRLACAVTDFIALVNGDLGAREGFMEGRLDVEGDVGLVWRLQKLLVSKKGA
ncbi:MAG: sterol-binding protein [Rhodobacterales bacterium]|nr:sterol-binding protein [Rhodobacterales bacterium]